MSQDMWKTLHQYLLDASVDDTVKVLTIQGAGNAFSAGADISEFETIYATPESARAANDVIAGALQAMDNFPKPSISMISGPCMGGGCALATACDIAIADSSAKFGINPTALGTAYSFRDTQRLVSRVGIQRAKRLLIGAEQIDAATALDWGLVSRVTEVDSLTKVAQEYTDRILNLSPDALTRTKSILRAIDTGTSEQTAELMDLFNGSFSSDDFAEGVEAFLAKRKPQF